MIVATSTKETPGTAKETIENPSPLLQAIEDSANSSTGVTPSSNIGNATDSTANVSNSDEQELLVVSEDTATKVTKAIKDISVEKSLSEPALTTKTKTPSKAATPASTKALTNPAKKTGAKKTITQKATVKSDKPVKKSKSAASKGKAKVTQEEPLSKDHAKLARFSHLLETFINSANALQDEFGGIPEQIQILTNRFNRYHGRRLDSVPLPLWQR
jgi:hypothetical protein